MAFSANFLLTKVSHVEYIFTFKAVLNIFCCCFLQYFLPKQSLNRKSLIDEVFLFNSAMIFNQKKKTKKKERKYNNSNNKQKENFIIY